MFGRLAGGCDCCQTQGILSDSTFGTYAFQCVVCIMCSVQCGSSQWAHCESGEEGGGEGNLGEGRGEGEEEKKREEEKGVRVMHICSLFIAYCYCSSLLIVHSLLFITHWCTLQITDATVVCFAMNCHNLYIVVRSHSPYFTYPL